MDSINVLIISSIGGKCLKQISAVSPRIKLNDASELWDAPDMIVSRDQGDCCSDKFNELLAEAEVLYGFRPPQNVLARAPKLKWFQTMLAGVDHFLDEDIINSRLIVTNMHGLHAAPVGETAFAMMIMLAKHAPFCFKNKQEKRWDRFIPELLRYKTVGIVGLGSIGREIARFSKAFGMKVLATRRSAKPGQRARYVDKLLPLDKLPELLSESDYVVLVLPNTSETRGMIGEKELRMMKPTAYLVNVGRGITVDEEKMIRALEEGWIAGAGLDAYTIEPLPLDSKLWELPNVIMSPHVSGRLTNYNEMTNEIFCDNLRRYVNGKRLRNVVNKKRGY